MKATCRLMNDGVVGPTETIDYTDERDARAWAAGQTGHPWDILTVCVFDEDGRTVESYEIDL